MSQLALIEPRTLESFRCDGEARVTDFFQAYANEMPPSMAERFEAYGAKFMERHARARLSSLFKLLRSQCNSVIADVHKEMKLTLEDEDAIRESIEEAAGFVFELSKAPESAALATKRKSPGGEGTQPKKGRSLSQCLPQAQQIETALPDSVFDVVTTPDPLINPITETELSLITDETLKFLCRTFGRHNVGLQIVRVYAAQIRRKVKIGPRGKKNVVLGADRDLAQSLVEKARNRTYKTVSAAPQLNTALPLAIV